MADDLDPRRHLKLEGTVNTRDVGGYARNIGMSEEQIEALRGAIVE